MRKLFLIIGLASILTVGVAGSVLAQSRAFFTKNKKDSTLVTERYLLRGSGLSLATFRDFATSPLFYTGPGATIYTGNEKITERRETRFDFNSSLNALIAAIPPSDYFEVVSTAILVNLQMYLHDLRTINSISTDDTKFLVGGYAQYNQNIRINPELQNASAGLESLVNVGAVGKVKFDVSRTAPRSVNFYLFQKQLKPVKRSLDFEGNLGLLNFNHRPSYAYVFDSEIDGTDTNAIDWLLDGYRWSWNGWQLGSRLSYTTYRPNGNGRIIAYQWQAAHAPGRYEPFQMAIHRIQFIMLIHNNKD